jgi:hypothetical protein
MCDDPLRIPSPFGFLERPCCGVDASRNRRAFCVVERGTIGLTGSQQEETNE